MAETIKSSIDTVADKTAKEQPRSDVEGTIEELEQKRSASLARMKTAEGLVAEAKAEEEAKKSAGTSNMAQGGANAGSGQMMQAAGQAQVVTGQLMITIAQSLAASGQSVWDAGLTANILMYAGISAVVGGAATTAVGATKMAAGNSQIATGTKELAEAVEKGVISKNEAGVAQKAMISAQIMGSKLSMLKSVKNEMQEKNPQMDDKQLEDMMAKVEKGFDDAFKAAAKSFHDGGILTAEGKDGQADQYFTQGENGEFNQVAVKMDESGNPILGDNGELQLDKELGEVGKQDPRFQDLEFAFAVVNNMKEMILGNEEEGIPPLARLELDGTEVGAYDINNPEEMFEFSQIVEKTIDNPPEFRFFENDNGDLVFQKWDNEKDQPIGDEILLDKITGKGLDLEDPKQLKEAQEAAQIALKEIGIGEGSEFYENFIDLVEDGFGFDNEALARLDLSKFTNANAEARTQGILDQVNARFGIGGDDAPSLADQTAAASQSVLEKTGTSTSFLDALNPASGDIFRRS